jgi:four helix bundle protein
MRRVSSFQQLVVWQKAMALCKSIYELTATLPDNERFGLVSQMRRAAVSVPSNIAEGHGRRTTGEFLHFVGISTGSLRELQTCVFLTNLLGFADDVQHWVEACDEVARLVYRFEESLERQHAEGKSR